MTEPPHEPQRPRCPVPAGALAGRLPRRLRAPHARHRRDRNVDELWSVPTGGGTPRRLTGGPADVAPAWSPDGSRLAFLRDGQLHVLAADGGEPEKVTDLPLGAGAPVWSPDGERIAFTSPVDPGRPDRRQRPAGRRRASTTRPTAAGRYGAIRSQLHVVDLASGDCRRLTDGDDAGQPAWSPDGRTVAFTPQGRRRQRPHLPHGRAPARRRRPQGRATGGRLRGGHRRHRLVQLRRREPAGRGPPATLSSGTPTCCGSRSTAASPSTSRVTSTAT